MTYFSYIYLYYSTSVFPFTERNMYSMYTGMLLIKYVPYINAAIIPNIMYTPFEGLISILQLLKSKEQLTLTWSTVTESLLSLHNRHPVFNIACLEVNNRIYLRLHKTNSLGTKNPWLHLLTLFFSITGLFMWVLYEQWLKLKSRWCT